MKLKSLLREMANIRRKRSCKEMLLFCGHSTLENKFKSSSYNQQYREPYVHKYISLLSLWVSSPIFNHCLYCICVSLWRSFAIEMLDGDRLITVVLFLWFKFAFKNTQYTLHTRAQIPLELTPIFYQNLLLGNHIILVICS